MGICLNDIRSWKNKHFPDWLWDVIVGAALTLLALIAWAVVVWLGVPFDCNLLVLAIPFSFTVWNQFLNRIFELKDAVLRMVVPVVVYLIILILK